MDINKMKDVFPPRYIGDGVYASFDGFHIWLTTQTGYKIALEPNVYKTLTQYAGDINKAFGKNHF